MWVAFHRFNKAVEKIGGDNKHFVREDCTDEAIDRTLKRLEQAKATETGNTAKMVIPWTKNDGYPNAAFGYSEEPITFRKVSTGWKIDANAATGIKNPEEMFAEDSWGVAFRTQVLMMNEISTGLESGKLKTTKDVIQAMEKHIGSLEGRIPLTKTEIYKEDSPARFLSALSREIQTLFPGLEPTFHIGRI